MFFSYRDRRAGDKKKVMALSVKEFIKRFSYHILPAGFVKIRHYGLFSTRVKQEKLTQVRKALGQQNSERAKKRSAAEVILKSTSMNIYQCPVCKDGELVVVKLIPSSRSSPNRLPTQIKTIRRG